MVAAFLACRRISRRSRVFYPNHSGKQFFAVPHGSRTRRGRGQQCVLPEKHFQMTLVELSPETLAESQKINPGLEHIAGDMRLLRLNRTFDAVFIHDAICYMTSEDDLRRALETAFAHCKPGGIAVVAPYYVKETFRAETEHGGRDRAETEERGLRWLMDV